MTPMSWFRSPSSHDLRSGGGRRAATTAGCLSRLLKRIVCFSSFPLCPLDRFKEDEREGKEEVLVGATAPVGAVARLMGVESLPREETMSSGRVESVKASRFLAYRELEDENFFILSFEKRRTRRSRRNSCRREKKESENTENLLPTLKKKTTNLVEKDCLAAKISFENEDESENSSPNSVLEFVGFSADQESASPEEISRLANSKMRRPLSEELDNCGDSTRKVMFDGLDLEIGNLVGFRHSSERLDEVGKMAAMDTMRSSWLHDEILPNKHCFMEIGNDIASNIFDHLLEELVIKLQQF